MRYLKFANRTKKREVLMMRPPTNEAEIKINKKMKLTIQLLFTK